MAKKLGDIMAPNGKYIKDGTEKTSWLKCGVLLETDNGLRIKLDCLPVNMGDGWLSVFEDRKEAKPSQPAQQGFRAPPQADGDTDVPF